MTKATITELWIYPVKSMVGTQLKSSEVTAEGLANDRQWMIIDEHNNFISQRKLPELALYKAIFDGRILHIQSPDNDSISTSPDECLGEVSTTIWGTFAKGLVAPDAVNQWLSRHLRYKTPLRLIYRKTQFRRILSAERFGNHTTAFADAAPYLIANRQSLIAINQQLPSYVSPLAMTAFRPNIVIDGIDAFEEHRLKTLTNKTVQFKLIDHCQRCSMITVNPITGQYQNAAEIFTAVSVLNPMPEVPKAPAFGVNSTLTSGFARTVCVGELLELQ